MSMLKLLFYREKTSTNRVKNRFLGTFVLDFQSLEVTPEAKAKYSRHNWLVVMGLTRYTSTPS